MHEQTLSNKLICQKNGYEIYRSEARIYDEYKDKYIGHTKVYYDVCFSDGGDIIESRKTLKEAVKFAQELEEERK